MQNIKIKTVVFALLFLIIFLAGSLAYAEMVGKSEGICLVTGSSSSSCSDVQSSSYGSLFGMKVSYFGLISFIILLLLYILASSKNKYAEHAHELFVVLTFVGSLVALYLLVIQFIILKTLCSTCTVIDFSVIFIFILSYVESKKRSRR